MTRARARRSRTALALLVASVLVAAPARAEDYAPLDRPGPPLTVSTNDLRASLTCTDDVRDASRAPVLLVPATTVTSRENFGWNWMPALRAAGIPYCATDQPGAAGQNMGDMQTRAEYVVYAIRRMHELAGRRISIVGHSQGGMVMRWPLRFWPDTRALVEDVVGMAGTNHGSTVVNNMCIPGCAPALWQQRAGSDWNTALNSRQETFAGIDYTEIYSRTDEFVQPNADDTGTSSLRSDGGRVTNVALQDVCPTDLNEHLLIGTTDATAWALGLDALTHDGPADERRIDPAVCDQDTMPGVDPHTGGVDTAEAVARVATQLATAPQTDAEPPLRCYALLAGCPAQAGAPAAATPCRSHRRVTLRVGRLGLRGVRVTADGRTIRVRRGRAVVDLRGRGPQRVSVQISGRTPEGRRVTITRHFRTCVPGRRASTT